MCFELFRCIPLKVDWSFNSPRASQGPPCLSIQTKLSAQSSEPQGLRTLHDTELYSWLPRSHGALIAETSMRKVHQSWCSKCFSGHQCHQCHQWSWCIYQLLLESLYTCECLVLRFKQCCWASVCDFEVCLRQLGMLHVLLQGTNQFILTKCSRW